jgi:hypothetical protein
MSQPPPPEPRDEVDDLYRQASALDPGRPGEAVRRRVLEHATQLASERANRPASGRARAEAVPRCAPRWRRPAAVFGTFAAAAIAALMIAPRFLMSPTAPLSRPPVATVLQAERREGRLSAHELGVPVPEEVAAAPQLVPPSPEPVPAAPAQPASRPSHPPLALAPAAKSTQASSDSMNAPREVPGPTVAAARRAAAASPPAPAANVIDAGTAFRHAAESGDLRTLDRLLAGQSDINARDAAGRTPLMLAILHGQTEVVSALLAYGADPNAEDARGTTPLEAARASGRPAIVAALQRYGARR